MSRLKDLTGKRLGRLTVLKRAPDLPGYPGRPIWWCRCDCGTELRVRGTCLIRTITPTRSCGCLRIERSREALTKNSNTFSVKDTHVELYFTNSKGKKFTVKIDRDNLEEVIGKRWIVAHRRVISFNPYRMLAKKILGLEKDSRIEIKFRNGDFTDCRKSNLEARSRDGKAIKT